MRLICAIKFNLLTYLLTYLAAGANLMPQIASSTGVDKSSVRVYGFLLKGLILQVYLQRSIKICKLIPVYRTTALICLRLDMTFVIPLLALVIMLIVLLAGKILRRSLDA